MKGHLNDGFSYILDVLLLTSPRFWEGELNDGRRWLIKLEEIENND